MAGWWRGQTVRIVIVSWSYSTHRAPHLWLPVLSQECRGQYDCNCPALLLLHSSPYENTVTFLRIEWTVLELELQSNHLQNVVVILWLVRWVCLLTHNRLACTPLSTYSNLSNRLPSNTSMLQIWHQKFWKLLILFLCFTSLKSPPSLFPILDLFLSVWKGSHREKWQQTQYGLYI